MTKVWFSDVSHFPSFSTVSAHWRHSVGLSEYPLPTPLRKFGSEFSVHGEDPIRHHLRRKVRCGVMVNPASHTKFLTEPPGQGHPPVLRPRLDVCSNHVGIGFVRNFIAREFRNFSGSVLSEV
jgi:hypothetical protein